MLLIKCLAVFLLIFSTISCSGSDNNYYTYKELVEIYSATKFKVNEEDILKLINDKYNLIPLENQKKYQKSISRFVDEKKWIQFQIEAIESFINQKRELVIKFYSIDGYDPKLNMFNDNKLLDEEKKNTGQYWKVYYWGKKYPQKFVLIQDQYENSRLVQKIYFAENRTQIKLIDFVKKKVSYYIMNKLIAENKLKDESK